MKGCKPLLIAALSIVLSSCASFAQPERPAYGGVDQVEAVNEAQLVGTWRITELNPISGSPSQLTVIEYRSDGTVTGQIEPNEEDPALGLGMISMNGQWSVANGQITHSDVTMKSDSNSRLGSLVASMVNRMGRDMGGEANIYELSSNRIVMVSDEGVAMQYDRQ